MVIVVMENLGRRRQGKRWTQSGPTSTCRGDPMSRNWIRSAYPGVRYREHPTRVFKRQKDKYFMIRFKRDGKTISESLGWLSDGMTASEASTLRGQIMQNIKKGVRPQSVAEMRALDAEAKKAEKKRQEAEKRAAVTFGEMADLFLDWADENKKSSDGDRSRYDTHIKRQFSKKRIKDISSFDLERLKARLKKKGLAAGTIVQCLQLMRAIFNKTRLWGKHDRLFPAVKFPKSDNRRVAFLTTEQAETLLNKIKGKSLKLWCQCVLALYAGLRFGEIASLELSDLDIDAGTIHIRDGKGGTRHAYLTEPISTALEELWAKYGQNPGLLFPARPGRKKKPGDRQDRVSPVFFRTLEELGFNDGIEDNRQKIVFHSLRHSFGSHLIMGGESLVTVQELMGHKDISTTLRYSHLAPDIKRRAADNLVNTLKKITDGGNKVVNLADQGKE
jgi:integrase